MQNPILKFRQSSIINPGHPFVDTGKYRTCAKFQEKLLNSVVIGARPNFNFLDKITGFSKTIRRATVMVDIWIYILIYAINI